MLLRWLAKGRIANSYQDRATVTKWPFLTFVGQVADDSDELEADDAVRPRLPNGHDSGPEMKKQG